MPTQLDDDLMKKVQAAVAAGLPQEEAVMRARQIQATRPQQKPGLLRTLATPFERAGRQIGGAGFEIARVLAARGAIPKKVLGQNLEYVTEQGETIQNPFLSEESLEKIQKHPFKEALKTTAGLASYAVPFGKGGAVASKLAPGLGKLAPLAAKTIIPGATSGALFEAGQPGATPQTVGRAGAFGVGGALAFRGGEKLFQGIKGAVSPLKTVVGKKATEQYLKASPTKFAEAIEEHGIDITDVAQRRIPTGASYDDVLGAATERGRGGIFKSQMDEAEKAISDTVKSAGRNIRLGKDEVITALKSELKVMKDRLGNTTKYNSLKKVIDQAIKKYNKGVSLNQAMKTIREANATFGRSIVETEKGAVASSAQKVEANALKRIAKGLFPDVAEALKTQEEILTLRPILNLARGKAGTTGIEIPALLAAGGLAAGGPLGLVGGLGVAGVMSALKSPAVTSRLMKVGTGAVGKAVTKAPSVVGQRATALGAAAMYAKPGEVKPTPETKFGETTVEQTLTGEQEILSPEGQWRWSKEANDWVPKTETGITPEKLMQAMEEDLQKTGGKNIAKLKSLYDIKVEKEEKGKKVKEVKEREANIMTAGITIDKALSGDLTGLGPFAGGAAGVLLTKLGGLGVPKNVTELNTQYNLLRQIIVKSFQGARMSDVDIELARGYTPTISDTPETARTKLESLSTLTKTLLKYMQQGGDTTEEGILETLATQNDILLPEDFELE